MVVKEKGKVSTTEKSSTAQTQRGVEAAEPMEVASCAGKEEKPTTPEAVPENSDKSQSASGSDEIRPAETAAAHKGMLKTRQTAHEHETRVFGVDHDVAEKERVHDADSNLNSMWSFEDAKAQSDAALAADAAVKTKATASAASPGRPAASAPSSSTDNALTIGEMVEKHLDFRRIGEKCEKGTITDVCI